MDASFGNKKPSLKDKRPESNQTDDENLENKMRGINASPANELSNSGKKKKKIRKEMA
jgi:hypothetical protein